MSRSSAPSARLSVFLVALHGPISRVTAAPPHTGTQSVGALPDDTARRTHSYTSQTVDHECKRFAVQFGRSELGGIVRVDIGIAACLVGGGHDCPFISRLYAGARGSGRNRMDAIDIACRAGRREIDTCDGGRSSVRLSNHDERECEVASGMGKKGRLGCRSGAYIPPLAPLFLS